MRSLAETAREGEFHSSRKALSFPELEFQLHYYTQIAGEKGENQGCHILAH